MAKTLGILLLLALAYGIYYAWQAFPIISGFGAKAMCSCVTLGGRTPQSVMEQELGSFPLSLGSFTYNPADSSATGSVWGLARRKAIYRPGLGCTLLVQTTEQELRSQTPALPSLPSSAAAADTLPWPLGNRLPDTLPGRLNISLLQTALDSAFAENPAAKKPKRTRAMVVVYKGQLVAERYADGFTAQSRHLGWSMTKSLTAALMGRLTLTHGFNIMQPAPVPAWQMVTDGRQHITTQQLLQQASGLNFNENYAGPADATNMLYKQPDMAAFTAAKPLREAPGSRFYYSSGNSNILSRIIRQTVGLQQYYTYAFEQLFYRLGMYSLVLEPDCSGTPVGSSYSWATARDWARFGLLYLQNGQWQGEQLLPQAFIEATRQPLPADSMRTYGYQFWLNAGPASNPAARPYPAAPPDMYYADGYEHQYVFIIPSLQLVVVRLGQSAAKQIGLNEVLGQIIAAVQ